LLLTSADNYGIMINITKGKKMKTKELKSLLWEVWHKAKEAGASRAATNAIIDAMVVIDKEAKKSEKVSETP